MGASNNEANKRVGSGGNEMIQGVIRGLGDLYADGIRSKNLRGRVCRSQIHDFDKILGLSELQGKSRFINSSLESRWWDWMSERIDTKVPILRGL
jgi:hypothetical protein